jgi:hypothetical protein
VFKILILMAFSASAVALAADPEGCLLAVVEPSHDIDPAGKPQTLTVTNNCGKDITAYSVRFRDHSGGNAAAAKAENRLIYHYLTYLADRFSRSDVDTWDAFVQSERRRLDDEIKLLETHLAVQDASGQPVESR